MVKLHSTIGLKFKGKVGEFIIQDVNGEQVLRQGYKENKKPTPEQLAVRERFKLASSWAKNLSTDNKRYLRQYYKQLYPSWTQGQPSTWYNLAKTFILTLPEFRLINAETGQYSIKHPAIQTVSEYNSSGELLTEYDNLSSLPSLDICTSIEKICNSSTAYLVITTLPGYEYKFNVSSTPYVPPELTCYPWFHTPCYEVRAIDRVIIKDNCWMIKNQDTTHCLPNDGEYGHVL